MTIFKEGHIPSIFLQDKDRLRKLDDNLLRYLNDLQQSLNVMFSNGISFADNMDGELITYTSGSAGSEDAVPHTLKRIPVGYIVVKNNKEAIIYDGTTSFTATNIYLISSQDSTILSIFVF